MTMTRRDGDSKTSSHRAGRRGVPSSSATGHLGRWVVSASRLPTCMCDSRTGWNTRSTYQLDGLPGPTLTNFARLSVVSHGRDGISGVSSLPGDPYPVPAEVPSPLLETEKHASDVILDILRKHPPGTVRIAAIGPLTNVALAWQKDPKTFLRVAGISVMGCALDVPGNVSRSGSAVAASDAAELISEFSFCSPSLVRRRRAPSSTRMPTLLRHICFSMRHAHILWWAKVCANDCRLTSCLSTLPLCMWCPLAVSATG